MTALFAIHDTMQFVAPDVATICVGQAASAAAVLLAAGARGKRAAELVDTDFPRWRLRQALARYATEDVRPYLARSFQDEQQPHEVHLQAAWGLGKLGEERAVDYLGDCLLSGEGADRFRCAQALCDIKGWPFEWDLSDVERPQSASAPHDERLLGRRAASRRSG